MEDDETLRDIAGGTTLTRTGSGLASGSRLYAEYCDKDETRGDLAEIANTHPEWLGVRLRLALVSRVAKRLRGSLWLALVRGVLRSGIRYCVISQEGATHPDGLRVRLWLPLVRGVLRRRIRRRTIRLKVAALTRTGSGFASGSRLYAE